MVLANLAQENNIGNYVKHYMVSNRQDNSKRKGFMKFLQNLALLVHLLMIAYMSRSQEVDFVYFIFLSYFYFSLDLLFIFLFIEQLGLGS